MQGQRRTGVAMGQHQHRETADSDLRIFRRLHMIATHPGGVLKVGGRIERDGFHRLQIQRVEKTHAVKAHTPMRVRRRGSVH